MPPTRTTPTTSRRRCRACARRIDRRRSRTTDRCRPDHEGENRPEGAGQPIGPIDLFRISVGLPMDYPSGSKHPAGVTNPTQQQEIHPMLTSYEFLATYL